MVNGVLGIAGVTVHVPVGVVLSMPSVRVTIQGIVNWYSNSNITHVRALQFIDKYTKIAYYINASRWHAKHALRTNIE